MTEFSIENSHSAGYWDERYAGEESVWSGDPNQRLVEQSRHLPAGSALDIGCGEGGDAVWLARRGWTVLAVDVSSVAVDKARARAASTLDPDVAARITWRPADILTWQPPPASFDLVSMQFLHLPRAALADAADRLADALRAGGTLLIVNHDPLDLTTTVHRPRIAELLLTATDIAATLDPDQWRVEVAEPFPRPFPNADGHAVTIHDAVVRAVRR